MLNLQFQTDASENEIPALLYAQNYAETDRNPDTEISKKLFDFYGNETAGDILLRIRLFNFANLSGNTFDAFLSRIRGVKVENSSALFEFIFFILSSPILLPLSFFAKSKSPHR